MSLILILIVLLHSECLHLVFLNLIVCISINCVLRLYVAKYHPQTSHLCSC